MNSSEPVKIDRFSANAQWYACLQRTLASGMVVNPRGMASREIICDQVGPVRYSSCVISVAERRLNYAFMAAEAAWILSGTSLVKPVSKYCDNIAKFSDDGTFMSGAYGPKVVDQLPYVVGALLDDRSTRQAVINVWRERPDRRSRDVPCTLSMQFLVREDQVHTIVTMRSSDVWLGVPYDLFTFSIIGIVVGMELNRRLPSSDTQIDVLRGATTIMAGSRHLYERDLKKVEELISGQASLHIVDGPRHPLFEGRTGIEDMITRLTAIADTLRNTDQSNNPQLLLSLIHDPSAPPV